jgi:hypothetical protein
MARNRCCGAKTIDHGRHRERSEAIHCATSKKGWIASSLTLLAMTSGCTTAFSRRGTPEFMLKTRRPIGGRRESRVRGPHPWPRVRKESTRALVTTGSAVQAGLPCANGFNGFLRGLPRDRAFLPPSPAGDPANLISASGYQDATTSPSAGERIRLVRCRVHRIPHPTSVTIAIRPSCGRGMGCSTAVSTK